MEKRKNTKYVGKRLFWHKKEIKEVVGLLVEAKTDTEVELIFDRILTTREINDVARRYKVLKMIEEGKSYADIMTETGMSSSVICRLSAKCGYGFQKSSGLRKPRSKGASSRKRTIKYKGVKVR
ncbi:hypothetical protein C4544_03010 [candidate division WS5 bacterium]|uniref:TrpR like protein, YerC/YecD n=1 Tax=candidate division WS5 bacterium TaxID=2093353 RepID=A0A419DEF1_9BACT|nr:MAG: hypothetical protein C4544_03010 [candidate division WS5 bacterium]